MLSLPVRIFIVVITSAYGVYKLSNGDQFGYIYLAVAAIFVVGYFRYGPIRPAFIAMRRGQFDIAQQLIATIKFPKLLSAQSRAYFHWINAVLATQEPEKLRYAEQQIRLAIDGALRTSNDRCLATATLAHIVAQSSNLDRARQILADAEKMPHKENVSDYLNKLKAEFEKAE